MQNQRDMKSVTPNLGLKDEGGINWHDYNYPPFINLMHYDKEELPSSVENITKFQKVFFELAVITQIVNVVSNIVLVVAENDEKVIPAVRILFSLLNLVIFPPGALFIFHQGYKGLAISSASLLTQYKVIQIIGCVVIGVLICLPWGCVNGVFTFWTPQYKAAKSQTMWAMVIIGESLLYGINLVNGIGCIVQVQNFNPYATQSGGGGSI